MSKEELLLLLGFFSFFLPQATIMYDYGARDAPSLLAPRLFPSTCNL